MRTRAAVFSEEEGVIVVSMEDYPSNKLGYAMDTLAIDGKYFSAPIDREPMRPWKWRYRKSIWPAVRKLLRVTEIKLERCYDGCEKD